MQRRHTPADPSPRPTDDVATLLHQVADQVALLRERDRIAMEVRAADLAAREARVDAQDARIRELAAALADAHAAAAGPVIDLGASGERRRLGKQLVRAGLVRKWDVRDALREQRRTGERLGRILVARGLLTPTALLQTLAQQDGVPPVGPGDRGIGMLPPELALEHRAVALEVPGGTAPPSGGPMAIAVRDLAGAVAVSEALGHVPELRLADAPTLVRLFAQAYGGGDPIVLPAAIVDGAPAVSPLPAASVAPVASPAPAASAPSAPSAAERVNGSVPATVAVATA
jgi:hypothetical protein